MAFNRLRFVGTTMTRAAAMVFMLLGCCCTVAAQNVNYELEYNVRQPYANIGNACKIDLVRKVGGVDRQAVSTHVHWPQTRKGPRIVNIQGPDIGHPTHVRIALGLHDTFEIGDFKLTLPNGDSVIWNNSSLFFNAEVAARDTGDGKFIPKPPPKTLVLDVKLGPPKDDIELRDTVVFIDNVGGDAAEALEKTYTVDVGHEVALANTTSQGWNAGASVSVGTEGGIPGLASVNASIEVSAGFESAWEKEHARVSSKAFQTAITLKYSKPQDAVLFSLFKIAVPWRGTDVTVGGSTAMLMSLNGNCDATLTRDVRIPSLDADGNVIPRSWSKDIEPMLSVMQAEGMGGTVMEIINERKEIWKDNGWIYEGDKAPEPAGFFNGGLSIYASMMSSLPADQHKYVFGGAGVLGLLGLISLVKLKAFKWKLAGLLAVLVGVGIPVLEFGVGREPESGWEMLTPAESQLHFSSIAALPDGRVVALQSDSADLWIKTSDNEPWKHLQSNPEGTLPLQSITASADGKHLLASRSPNHIFLKTVDDSGGWGHMAFTTEDGPDIKCITTRKVNDTDLIYAIDHSDKLWSRDNDGKWSIIAPTGSDGASGVGILDIARSRQDERLICLNKDDTLRALSAGSKSWEGQEVAEALPNLKLVDVMPDGRLIGITKKDELMLGPALTP